MLCTYCLWLLCSVMTELNSLNRDHMVCKVSNNYPPAFSRKGLQTPAQRLSNCRKQLLPLELGEQRKGGRMINTRRFEEPKTSEEGVSVQLLLVCQGGDAMRLVLPSKPGPLEAKK